MNTTVAVTLITAVSTLAGVGISGWVAFLISRTQSDTQLKVSHSQQLEQRSTERRAIRRDAYLQFLNQFAMAEQALENAWQSNRPPIHTQESIIEFMRPVMDAVSDVRKLTNLVALEGPAKVTTSAMVLSGWLTLECADVVAALKATPQGNPICLHNDEKFIEVTERRGKSKIALIEAIQKSLDNILGDDPIHLAPSGKASQNEAIPHSKARNSESVQLSTQMKHHHDAGDATG